MQEIFAQFPTQKKPSTTIGEQIYTLPVPNQQLAVQPLEEIVPITIGKPKLAILEALLVFRLMTAEMLTEYLFRPSMLRDTQKHLREMEQSGYVRRSLPMKQTRFGSAPYAYGLGSTGYKYLKALGRPVPARFRSQADELHEGYPISHTLSVNRVLMQALYLDENDPNLLLRDFVHEKDLNAKPLTVQLPQDTKTIAISPDLWLYFYTKDRTHYCFCVEVNLSRMWQKDWREKVRAYLYCLEEYEARFGSDVLTVAVIVTTGRKYTKKPLSQLSATELTEREQDQKDREKRLVNFLLWTEAELTALGETTEADMFRFTNVTLDTITPRELFYGAHWHTPFAKTPRPLILGAKEDVR